MATHVSTDHALFCIHTGAKGKQLPKGIYLSTHELSNLINDTSHSLLHQLDRELNLYRETIQSNKQLVVSLKEEEQDNIDKFRPQEVSYIGHCCVLCVSSYVIYSLQNPLHWRVTTIWAMFVCSCLRNPHFKDASGLMKKYRFV